MLATTAPLGQHAQFRRAGVKAQRRMAHPYAIAASLACPTSRRCNLLPGTRTRLPGLHPQCIQPPPAACQSQSGPNSHPAPSALHTLTIISDVNSRISKYSCTMHGERGRLPRCSFHVASSISSASPRGKQRAPHTALAVHPSPPAILPQRKVLQRQLFHCHMRVPVMAHVPANWKTAGMFG